MENILSVQQIKDHILKYVAQYPGATAVEIVTRAGIHGENFSLDLPVMLEEMVNTGKLTQVVISPPTKNLIHPTTYFPADGELTICNMSSFIRIMFNDKTIEVIPAAHRVEIIKH